MSSPQYFAQVIDGVVTDVHVVEAEFMAENSDRYPGVWVETFFDTPGKTYAGVGFTWNGTDFVAPEVITP
jgi:hypothetical protein